MAKDPIVFALSLPSAELTYDEAKQAGAAVVATQMNNWPNTVSVAMAYPGILRGAMDVKATRITSQMLVAAALALSGMIGDEALTAENVLPKLMGEPAAPTVARAVAQAAIEHNVAQTLRSPQSIEKRVQAYLTHGSKAWVAPPAVPAPITADEQAMELRRRYQGVLEIKPLIPMLTQELYSHVYAKPQAVKACQAIYNKPSEVYELTCKSNLVAVITDGSAVLGLGNIGSGAGLPVMEGKAVLFKAFGGVEAFPVCLQTQNVDELLRAIKHLTPMFGGINLEDISAPRCFELEERLIAETDIPIFHDDQHGTAIVTVAAILNAAKAVNKALPSLKIVVNGAGASALSVTNLLLEAGVQEIVVCDTQGAIFEGRPNGMNPFKSKIALLTNRRKQAGQLADHLQGADVVIGLSVPGAITQDMVRSMAADPIIMAMANPTPEIMPHEAKAAGARIIATGRSDFPNQVNNCLAFPGLFRGALDVRAKVITNRMKLAAARAIASVVSANEWEQGVIIPSLFNPQVGPLVAQAVAATALAEGQARRSDITPEQVHDNLANFLATGQLRIL
jgi:malate dehydrogenase (oxaloacetate-decarboxylating)